MKNPIAELHKHNSFEFIKPRDAEENKEYFCPDPQCPDPDKKLFLRKSSMDKKFFSHRPGMEHETHPKTLFHKMMVAEFQKISKMSLPEPINGKKEIAIDHQNSIVDFNGLDGDVPDICLVDKDGSKYFVDVTIGHPINKKKLESVKSLHLPLIEVMLEGFYNENNENINQTNNFLIDKASTLISTSSKIAYLPSDDKINKKPLIAAIGGAVLLGAAGLATYLGMKNK